MSDLEDADGPRVESDKLDEGILKCLDGLSVDSITRYRLDIIERARLRLESAGSDSLRIRMEIRDQLVTIMAERNQIERRLQELDNDEGSASGSSSERSVGRRTLLHMFVALRLRPSLTLLWPASDSISSRESRARYTCAAAPPMPPKTPMIFCLMSDNSPRFNGRGTIRKDLSCQGRWSVKCLNCYGTARGIERVRSAFSSHILASNLLMS